MGPQLKVVVVDLSNEKVVPLGRDVEFPMPPRLFLALDDLTEAQMATLRSAAATIASIHGVTPRPPVPAAGSNIAEWRYSDTGLEVFALVVPPACPASNDTILAESLATVPFTSSTSGTASMITESNNSGNAHINHNSRPKRGKDDS